MSSTFCFPFFFACYLALLRHWSSCTIWILLILFCKIIKITSIKSLWVDNLRQEGEENSPNRQDQLELEPVLPPLGCTTTHRLKVESTKAAEWTKPLLGGCSAACHRYLTPARLCIPAVEDPSFLADLAAVARGITNPHYGPLTIAKSDRDFGFSRQGFCLGIWDFLGSWSKTRIFFLQKLREFKSAIT